MRGYLYQYRGRLFFLLSNKKKKSTTHAAQVTLNDLRLIPSHSITSLTSSRQNTLRRSLPCFYLLRMVARPCYAVLCYVKGIISRKNHMLPHAPYPPPTPYPRGNAMHCYRVHRHDIKYSQVTKASSDSTPAQKGRRQPSRPQARFGS